MTELEQVAVNFVEAYDAKKAARQSLREYRQEHGSCDWYDSSGWETARPPCYATDDSFEDWCDVCQGAQPLWEVRRLATIKATSAMNKLLHRGRLP